MARTPDDEDLTRENERQTLAFYNEHAALYARQTMQADLGQLYLRFLPLLPPLGRILDLGCGGGRDLRAFKKLGFNCVGMEPSRQLAYLAAEFSSCEVVVARAQDLKAANAFDGVWACASLLHLPRLELPLAIARVQTALRGGGVLFLSMQEGSGSSIASDGRFYARYSRLELKSIVVSAGMSVIDQWSTPDTLPGRESLTWLNLLAVAPKA